MTKMQGYLLMCLCALVAIGSGCTTHLEQDTPASTPRNAEPVAPIASTQPSAPGGVTTSAPAASPQSPYIGRPMAGAVQPVSEDTYAASIERFRGAYAKAGAPRIAIYMNRSLSDEVREWITPVRGVVSGEGEKVTVGSGPTVVTPGGAVVSTGGETSVEGSADTTRGVSAYTQYQTAQPTRRNPAEMWMWRFEDNFFQPFLKAGTKLVDRATMVRLTASGSGQENDPYTVTSVKQVEMDALTEYADIFIEVLVTRDHTSPSGYAFRAVAKQTKDGIISGSVTKTGRDSRYEKSFEVVSGPGGYDLQRSSDALVLENVSQELAIDLMNSLATSWGG